jgi:tetratricopeptide (TPR) repeat protein
MPADYPTSIATRQGKLRVALGGPPMADLSSILPRRIMNVPFSLSSPFPSPSLGDGLYEFGRTAEARSAYEKALAVNPSDVRSRYCLAWVHARDQNHRASLAAIAEAMAFDKRGEFRDRLLQKQQEVLMQLSVHSQQEFLLTTNLVSKHAEDNHESTKE